MIHLPDKTQQDFFFFGQRGGFQIAQHALYQFLTPQQFRRNCGVGL